MWEIYPSVFFAFYLTISQLSKGFKPPWRVNIKSSTSSIMDMETEPTLIESLLASIESYVKTTYQLTKLKAVEKITLILTSLMSWVIIGVVMLLFALFSSIGLALYLGDLLGKTYYGFFSMAILYLALGGILHFFLLKWLRKAIAQLIISTPL